MKSVGRVVLNCVRRRRRRHRRRHRRPFLSCPEKIGHEFLGRIFFISGNLEHDRDEAGGFFFAFVQLIGSQPTFFIRVQFRAIVSRITI